MRLIHTLRDPGSAFSIAHRMRAKRFEFFRDLFEQVPQPVRILDVGGTEDYWERMGFLDPKAVHLTILNLEAPKSHRSNVETLSGDACDMVEFKKDAFDIVFSNSVIEHVGGLDRQHAMAREIQRVGKRYFVQTPNRNFPIEPHFMFPCFQFMPLRVQVWLLMHLNLTFGGKPDSVEAAQAAVRSVKLLDERTFSGMFEGAQIYRERVLGLTKSFVVYYGWNR